MAEKYLIRDGGDEVCIELRQEGGRTFVRRDGAGLWRDVKLERIGESGLYLLMVDSHPIELYLERRRGGAIVTIGSHIFDYSVAPWRPASTRTARSAARGTGPVGVTAPMTGSIIEVRCVPGDVVRSGQVLVVIESMKMNNELRAPASGRVKSVPVEAGQRVSAGDLLVGLEA